MPRVEFLESVFGPEKVVDAPDGGSLLDLCDEHYAPVPFSCRSATCATCQVLVVSGGEYFEPPNDAEEELLAIVRSPKGPSRLACQAVVKPGPGIIRLRSVDG